VLTGLLLSAHVLPEIVGTYHHGPTDLDVSPTVDEIDQRVAQVAIGRPWRPILVWVIDGANMPLQPETAKGRRPGRHMVETPNGCPVSPGNQLEYTLNRLDANGKTTSNNFADTSGRSSRGTSATAGESTRP
jgi:hypothetical protein